MLGRHLLTPILIVLIGLLASCRSIPSGVPDEYSTRIEAETYLAAMQVVQLCSRDSTPCRIIPGTALAGIDVSESARTITVDFNEFLGYQPLRPESVSYIYSVIEGNIDAASEYDIRVTSGGYEISELVPNLYRDASLAVDTSRKPERPDIPQIVRRVDRPPYDSGLSGRHLALWPSHGWYYEHRLNRWEWQRARLFQTVEDLLPFGFVVPYLTPMLENSGASVFLPRERDVQTNEIVVDNDSAPIDSSRYGYFESDSAPWQPRGPGFTVGAPPYAGTDRPFQQGTYKYTQASTVASDTIRWTPDIPEPGEYAVHIAYASLPGSVKDALYTVYHTGGASQFRVNQQIGGGTWIYLGTFNFAEGANSATGSVMLTNASGESGIVTADAVRFGGGMGNVARNGQTSGRPRFMEAARYYMQYAGMPDSLVFDVTDGEDNDYIDDYRSRGEWVNYLRGTPYGPNKDRTQGLGIPVDLSLAFHTDAGVTRRDTTIGTLLIYSTPGMDSTGVFPDSVSRLANRDFSDILQTQIVEDIRATYDSTWTRRSMWDKDYSEAHRPNVPSALLELLSHQNFEDMKYALDPAFKFRASRSIYKAILRYLADAYGTEYIVQPLPVDHVHGALNPDSTVTLSWRAVEDPIEPSAIPERYRVYTAVDDSGFDNGVTVNNTTFSTLKLTAKRVYRFVVTAINDGGESFPSETIAAGFSGDTGNTDNTVLVVNGFDRVSAPAVVEEEGFSGFVSFLDEGVPDRRDLAYTGMQYDYDFFNPWTDDDAPGHGASFANHETVIISGNTFDFSSIHGQTFLDAGWSFVTVSDEAVSNGLVDLSAYSVVDLLLGEERQTNPPGSLTRVRYEAFPSQLRSALGSYLEAGGRLIVSGAYVGTDLFAGEEKDAAGPVFGREMLGYLWRTNHAARTGGVIRINPAGLNIDTLHYSSDYRSPIYKVEAPDAIEPADPRALTFLRYAENNMSAGVLFDTGIYRVASIGFPLETVVDASERLSLVHAILEFLGNGTATN